MIAFETLALLAGPKPAIPDHRRVTVRRAVDIEGRYIEGRYIIDVHEPVAFTITVDNVTTSLEMLAGEVERTVDAFDLAGRAWGKTTTVLEQMRRRGFGDLPKWRRRKR